MKVFAVILALAAIASATPSRDPSWLAYKRSFNKTYRSEAEETMRHRIWRHNLKKIQHHNLNADLKMQSVRLGVNAYSDLSHEEFKSKMLGFRMDLKKPGSKGATFLVPNNVKIPHTIDWRAKGYVTPVKDQGDCGSCWAFSTTGSLEGQHFRKTGKLVSLSEQNLVDCSGNFGNEGCNGGLMDSAFKYIKANKGIDTERSYPYTAQDGNCHFKKAFVGATDNGFVDITSGDEKILKAASATVGPISIAIDASSSEFQSYKSGVYENDACSSTELDHGVLLVGYGTFEGKDYWLVKNSWGPSWGMQGYIMMARNRKNMCGVATMASYPLV